MGVFHLMGLGLSPGTVTVPLSYLGHRYQRWNEKDKSFFAGSGEVAHREQGKKVGDVQGLVVFTTSEVILGQDQRTWAFPYADNRSGQISKKLEDRRPMKEVLRRLLNRIYPDISGGRTELPIFWCQVERRDIRETFERVAKVVIALAKVGGEGKEIWMNMTGGTNVINFALELASALSGEVARIYYIQAENQESEKCVRYTDESRCWVDLPVMPLAISELGQATLDTLEELKQCSLRDLYSLLKADEKYWSLIQEISEKAFRESYLTPMWKQRLIVGNDERYEIGPQWNIVAPYQAFLDKIKGDDLGMVTK